MGLGGRKEHRGVQGPFKKEEEMDEKKHQRRNKRHSKENGRDGMVTGSGAPKMGKSLEEEFLGHFGSK